MTPLPSICHSRAGGNQVRRMRFWIPACAATTMVLSAAPAYAQADGHGGQSVHGAAEQHEQIDDPHAGHAMHGGQAQDDAADPHAGHQMSGERAEEPADPHAGHDMSGNASGGDMQVDAMADPHAGHAMDGGAAPDETPPPEAFSGPVHAADAIWGEDAMRASREELRVNQGGQEFSMIMVERLEARIGSGEDAYLWDAQAWHGGDIDKLWLKTEGEGGFDSGVESAEFQALWSHAIGPFFDLQSGVRVDAEPVGRAYAVLGVQGLAPYFFEIDAAAFLSDEGDLTARIEAEYDQRITQRLILQPRAELLFSAQDVEEQGIGAGLASVELGLRLRYEFSRHFAPYIGIGWERKIGDSADFARAEGEDPDRLAFLAGLRFWF